MRRREFITFFGGAAAAWPLGAHAQQPAMPVVGFLRTSTFARSEHLVAAFHSGLAADSPFRDTKLTRYAGAA